MYERILVAIDGSDTSSRACVEAIRLASAQKARLRVLYVVSYAYVSAILGGGQTGDLLRRLRADAQTALDAAEVAGRNAGLEVEPRLLEHHSTQIGEGIIEDAQKWQADLIVMGTHGRRGFARDVLGSDAVYVAGHARVPVLLVRSIPA
ncbi:MAG TPA: universal stress protein [Steroidobacteraceae bacterium]|jgi:nucleotide-binding universal stress UspA family protein|nr:universal stress protein [Steroidobacteraceae bacterium]